MQSNVYFSSLDQVEKLLTEEFGKNWKDFLSFDGGIRSDQVSSSSISSPDNKQRSPILLGAGCVAQVLLGKIGNKEVAVKMLHPHIKAMIDADISILNYVCWLIEFIPGASNFSLLECVDEFSKLMTNQLDLEIEANNLELFRKNFKLNDTTTNELRDSNNLFNQYINDFVKLKDKVMILLFGSVTTKQDESVDIIGSTNVKVNPVANNESHRYRQHRIRFPMPIRPYVTKNVLIETYENGVVMTSVLDKLTVQKRRHDIAKEGLNAILKMVFEDNFIHAGTYLVSIVSNLVWYRFTFCNNQNTTLRHIS